MRQELQFQTEIFHPGSNPSLTSSLSLTDTRRLESEAVADARDPLRPSSLFSLLASVSITAAFFLGTPRQARWARRPTSCPSRPAAARRGPSQPAPAPGPHFLIRDKD